MTENFKFYMSLRKDYSKTSYTQYNIIRFGDTDLLQTSSSNLYLDEENTLKMTNQSGEYLKSSTNVNIYNYNLLNADLSYNSFDTTIFRLPEGSITISYDPKYIKKDNYYKLRNNTVERAQIVSGTGIYLNARGYVTIETGVSENYLVKIYIFNTITPLPV